MKSNTYILLKKELKEVFRDKKSLMMMLIIPFMIPLLILGMSALFNMQVDKSTKTVSKVGFTYQLTKEEKKLLKKANIKPIEKEEHKIKKLYKKNKIALYLTKNKNNNYTIYYDQNNEEAITALSNTEQYLNSYKTYLQNIYLINKDINPEEVQSIININYQDTGKKDENFYSNYITNYAFLFIIMAITISATYPATDTTAGEKERGTLETLLTFPIKTKDILLGKYLSVTISSIITGLISFILSLISLSYVGKIFDIYKGINLVPSISANIISILIIIAYSFLISGLCIAIASYQKTFKEAQSALTPLTFISFFPGFIAFMINVKTNILISLIPFINYTQIVIDVNEGRINYLHIILMLASTIIYIIIIMTFIIKQYNKEKILFTN